MEISSFSKMPNRLEQSDDFQIRHTVTGKERGDKFKTDSNRLDARCLCVRVNIVHILVFLCISSVCVCVREGQ